MIVEHQFGPYFDQDARVLLLGSFPSLQSRKEQFYYAHSQNRFWKVVAAVFECPVPQTTEEKRVFLLENGIALWDVIASCEIRNSADSSIRKASANPLDVIFSKADIRAVFTNGKTADKLYRKYIGQNAVCLPSTSPANAAWTLERLTEAWRVIRT